MATVTGTLKDFNLGALAAFMPVITFRPSGPGVTPTSLLASKPVRVTPATDGSFTVNLAPTDDVRPARWYEITIEWQSAGVPTQYDFADWKLTVPAAGGNIADLVAAPTTPSFAWIAETPPPNPTPDTWWLIPSTGELKEWS